MAWGVVVLVVALLLGWLLQARRAQERIPGAESRRILRPEPRRQVAVIVNPTKLSNDSTLRATISAECLHRGFGVPLWLETTVEDPGTGQADAARSAGVCLVFVLGGDGTVRTVLNRLAGTEIPVALLPAGTGNLLARNLSLPVNDLNAALGVGFGGRDRRIDLAMAEIDVSSVDSTSVSTAFTVMAGLGFDAEVMASVEPELKSRVGWWAYVAAGVGKLSGRDHKVTVTIDDRPPIHRRVRSVVIGNCGILTGGIRLMPEAVVDDGLLDVVIVAPRGLVGWAPVLLAILSGSRRGHRRIEHLQGVSVQVLAGSAMHVQLDGDAMGTARALRARVAPGAAVVRVGTSTGRGGPAGSTPPQSL
jgi:diacylglycerol kinase family enzyme